MLASAEPQRCAVVIFGASGDLARRKLVPALYNLAREGLLPEGTVLVGFGRTPLTDESFRRRLLEGLRLFSRSQPVDAKVWRRLRQRVFYQCGDYRRASDFRALHRRLKALDARFGTGGNRVFYLSLPPDVVAPVLENLSAVGSLRRQPPCAPGQSCFERVVFEKPFGMDLESARRLNDRIDGLLDESQVFRMDHYLGKETVQNISVLRFANSVFERVWDAQAVSWIRVTVAEDIGVEGRGAYFDGVGILRDMMQNHVLQLLTLVTMEPPASLEADAIRDEKVKVLRCLRRLEGQEVWRSAVRGQYGRGTVGGQPVCAYREEEGVNPLSETETFVGIRTYIDNWRWAGVPVYLTAGKRLPVRLTEVSIQFKAAPGVLFGALKDVASSPNRLTLRIQPDEGVSLRFVTKAPGLRMSLKMVDMDFPYASAFKAASPEAYERLLLDVMAGNSALFARRDEVELAWQFVSGIMEEWQKRRPEFPNYAAGTWGPVPSEQSFRPDTDYSQAAR